VKFIVSIAEYRKLLNYTTQNYAIITKLYNKVHN